MSGSSNSKFATRAPSAISGFRRLGFGAREPEGSDVVKAALFTAQPDSSAGISPARRSASGLPTVLGGRDSGKLDPLAAELGAERRTLGLTGPRAIAPRSRA